MIAALVDKLKPVIPRTAALFARSLNCRAYYCKKTSEALKLEVLIHIQIRTVLAFHIRNKNHQFLFLCSLSRDALDITYLQ